MTVSNGDQCRRILIVDDDPDIHQLLTVFLNHYNYQLVSTFNGTDALARLRDDSSIDLILLDLGLPDISGLQLLQRFADAKPHAPVLVITADSTSDSLLTAIRRHAYQYLRKPFVRQDVENAVENALKAGHEPRFEVVSARPEWLELSIPCTRSAADRLEHFIRQLSSDLGLEIENQVGQVFRELVMNAVEWGGNLNPNRRVRVACVRSSRLLVYRIADPGPGFKIEEIDHASFANADDPIAYLQVRESKGLRPGGLGIVMVKAMADEVIYNEARNEVMFVKFIPSGNS